MSASVVESSIELPEFERPRGRAQLGLVAPPSPSTHSRRLTFLDQLDPEDRIQLGRLGTARRLNHGKLLFLQGERSGRVGIVLSGLVNLSAADESGHRALIAIRKAGDLIGEVEALIGGSRVASATTIGHSTIQVFDLEEFEWVLEQCPSAARALARTLAWDMRSAIRYRLRAALPVPVRLAAWLIELADDHGAERNDGAIEIDLPLSQDELAALVDSSRDAVARTLAVWRRQRIVETGRRRLVVLDPNRLAERAGNR